jgi:hypothetical protein
MTHYHGDHCDDDDAPPFPADPASGHTRQNASQTVNLRQIPRQATSAVAFVGPLPADGDPLLGFTPYIHAAPRARSITPQVQRAFVAHLAATGIVKQAARHVGRSLEALYRLRHRPGAEGFSAAWDAALERGMQRLEDVALERGIAGTRTPIVSGGAILGWWDKPDNALLRFLLQHRLPQKYGVHNLKPGHPIYESIRAEVLAEQAAGEPSEQEVFDSIDAFIDDMKVRRAANAKILAEGDWGVDAGAGEEEEDAE